MDFIIINNPVNDSRQGDQYAPASTRVLPALYPSVLAQMVLHD